MRFSNENHPKTYRVSSGEMTYTIGGDAAKSAGIDAAIAFRFKCRWQKERAVSSCERQEQSPSRDFGRQDHRCLDRSLSTSI